MLNDLQTLMYDLIGFNITFRYLDEEKRTLVIYKRPVQLFESLRLRKAGLH